MHIKFWGHSYPVSGAGWGDGTWGLSEATLFWVGGHVLNGSFKAICGKDSHPGQHASFSL